MKVTFEGGEQGFYALVADLAAEGLQVEYDEPLLTRSAGETVLVVVLYIVNKATDDAASEALKAAAKVAIERIRKRFPKNRADLSDD